VLQVPTHIVAFALLFPFEATAEKDIADKNTNNKTMTVTLELPARLREQLTGKLYDMVNCF
jgi:hypothetical protein